MSKYAVWNKKDKVITPIGEVLTAQQWIDRYPIAEMLDTVVAGGTINGAFFGVYDQMVEMYTSEGCDFSGCTTQQEHLDRIEQFEDERNQPSAVTDANTRIADALEDLVVMNELQMEG